MSDSNETLQNINSSLQSMTELNNKMLKQLDDINTRGYEPMYKYSKELEKKSEKRTKILKEQVSILGKISSKIREIVEFDVSFRLIDIVKSSFKIEQSLMQIGVQMGKGREGGKELYKQFAAIQRTTGQSTERVREMVETLGKNKFQGDIQKVGGHMLRFAHATGISVGEAAQLTTNLSRVGGLGDKSLMQITAGMTKVQQRIGISAEGMSALASSISVSAHNMVAFGKTEQDIKLMAMRTTALVGALEKVGISANEAIGLIEKLTDPERIEENIALYSQLGISISDALNGGDITGQIGAGLKDMAAKAAAMGPIAGAQYAKAFGISYKDLMKANQADVIGEMNKTAEDMSIEDPQQTMIELQKNVKTTLDYISETLTKFEGFIRGFGPIILAGAAILLAVVPTIFKKLGIMFHNTFLASVESVSSDLEKGVEGGLEMGGEKGGEKLKNNVSKIFKGFSKEALGKGDFITFINNEQFELVNKMEAKMRDQKSLLEQEADELEKILRQRELELKNIEDRASAGRELSYAELSAQKALRKEIIYREELLRNVNVQKDELERVYHIENKIQHLTGEGLTALLKQRESITAEIQEQVKAQKSQIKNTEKTIKDLEDQKGVLETQKALYEQVLKSSSSTVYEIANAKKEMYYINKEIDKMNDMQEDLIENKKKERKELTELNRKLKETKEAEKQIKTEIDDRIKRRTMETGVSGGLVNNLHRAVKAIGSSIKGAASGIRTAAVGIFNGLKRRVKDIIAEARKLGPAGVAGKAIGALGKLVGPTLIIGLLMKAFQPILENLMGVLSPLFDMLNGVFGKLFSTLIKSLLPPLLKILKFIWPILTGLGFILGLLVKGIGALINVLSFGFAKELGDGLMEAGDGLMALKDSNAEIMGQIDKSAQDIKNSNLENSQSSDKNTEALNGSQPTELRGVGNLGFTESAKGGTSTQNSLQVQKANDAQKDRDRNQSVIASASQVSVDVEKRMMEATEGVENLLQKIWGWLENVPLETNRTISLEQRNNNILPGIGS